jgi:hypothetical protein
MIAVSEMHELSIEQVALVSGGGEAYDAGHAAGEAVAKSFQIALAFAGLYFMMNT